MPKEQTAGPDRIPERVGVDGGHRAVIDMTGMLLHIQRQDRMAACQGVAVVGRPLIDELAIPRRLDS